MTKVIRTLFLLVLGLVIIVQSTAAKSSSGSIPDQLPNVESTTTSRNGSLKEPEITFKNSDLIFRLGEIASGTRLKTRITFRNTGSATLHVGGLSCDSG